MNQKLSKTDLLKQLAKTDYSLMPLVYLFVSLRKGEAQEIHTKELIKDLRENEELIEAFKKENKDIAALSLTEEQTQEYIETSIKLAEDIFRNIAYYKYSFKKQNIPDHFRLFIKNNPSGARFYIIYRIW